MPTSDSVATNSVATELAQLLGSGTAGELSLNWCARALWAWRWRPTSLASPPDRTTCWWQGWVARAASPSQESVASARAQASRCRSS